MTLIKQAVIERRKVECPTYSTATDDIQIMNNHIPLPLTSEFVQFSKRQLIERHRSRFSMQQIIDDVLSIDIELGISDDVLSIDTEYIKITLVHI